MPQVTMTAPAQNSRQTPPVSPTSPLAQRAMQAMSEMGLDRSENRQHIKKIQQQYNRNENRSLFTTMVLFAKHNLLSKESFHYLKSSMNLIGTVSNVMNALASVGLLSSPNLASLINLPALKELTTLMKILEEEEAEELNQTTFDRAVENAKPISEKMVADIQADDKSKTVGEALLRCATKQVSSETLLQAVKSHPFPQRMASAVIGLKEQSLKWTESMLNRLIGSDEPDQLLKSFLGSVGRGFETAQTEPAVRAPQPEKSVSAVSPEVDVEVEPELDAGIAQSKTAVKSPQAPVDTRAQQSEASSRTAQPESLMSDITVKAAQLLGKAAWKVASSFSPHFFSSAPRPAQRPAEPMPATPQMDEQAEENTSLTM